MAKLLSQYRLINAGFISCLFWAVSAGCGAENPFKEKSDKGTDTNTSTESLPVSTGGGSVSKRNYFPRDGDGPVGSPITVGVGIYSPDKKNASEAKSFGCAKRPIPPLNQIKTGCMNVCGWVMPLSICDVSPIPIKLNLNSSGFAIKPEQQIDPRLQPAFDQFKRRFAEAGVAIEKEASDNLTVEVYPVSLTYKSYTSGDGLQWTNPLDSGMVYFVTGVDSNGAVSNWTHIMLSEEHLDSAFGELDPNLLEPFFHLLGHALFRVDHPYETLRACTMLGVGGCRSLTKQEREAYVNQSFSAGYIQSLPKLKINYQTTLPPKPIEPMGIR